MEKMLVLYRITVDSRQEEFEEAYRTYKPTVDRVPGHFTEMLVRSSSDPSAYMIVSTWQPESFFAWLRSPAHAEIADLLQTYKRGEAQISRYKLIDSFERVTHTRNVA